MAIGGGHTERGRGRALLLVLLMVVFGRMARGQCYSFVSGSSSLTVRITNLPQPVVHEYGSGENVVTTYDYDLARLPGNSVTATSGDFTHTSDRFETFKISTTSGPMFALVFTLVPVDRGFFLANVVLTTPAPGETKNRPADGLPANLPTAVWIGNKGSATFTILASKGLGGEIERIESCDAAAPVVPVCTATLANKAGDLIQLTVSLDTPAAPVPAAPLSYRFSSSSGDLDASVTPGPAAKLLPPFLAAKDNETVRGTQMAGPLAKAFCKINSTILPAAGRGSMADDVQRFTVGLQGFLRYDTTLQLTESVPYQQAMAGLHSALWRFDPKSEEDRRAFSEIAQAIASYPRNISYIPLQETLEKFAELRIPVDDALADRFFGLYAQAVGADSSHPMIGPGQVPAMLVFAGDGQREGNRLRFAAFLYEKALQLGDAGSLNFLISDRTPTATKLASCLLTMGDEEGAKKYLPRQAEAEPATGREEARQDALPCREGDGFATITAVLEQARYQLAKGDATASVATLERVLPGLTSCARDTDDPRAMLRHNHALALLASAQAETGNVPGALTAFEDFAADFERVLDRTLMEGTEGTARIPYILMLDDTDALLAGLAQRQEMDRRAGPIALQILISRTGRLPEMAGDRMRFYRDADARRLLKLRAERATLVLRGRAARYRELLAQAAIPANLSAPPGTDPVQEAIAQLADMEENLTDLSERKAGLAPFSVHAVTVEEVAHHLDADTTVFFYSTIPRRDDRNQWPAQRYDYILLTLNARNEVRLHHLDEVERTNSLIQRYLALLRDLKNRPANRAKLNELSKALRSELFWNGPIQSVPKKVVIIPDGLIATVPFAALLTADGQPLLAKVDITYASGLRELVRGSQQPASRKPAVFVANPSDDKVTENADAFYLTRPFEPIEQVKYELQGIAQSLGDNAKIYSGKDATEAWVKSLASPSILHIAAHGRFIQNTGDAFLDDFEMVSHQPNGLSAGSRRVINPLLHSYLALGEYTQVRPLDQEDGVLTALEIAGLDLAGTDLAVASGCSTGAGPIERGDGVYSLRTAFSLAGAKTQIVSLWETTDGATRALMTYFYDLLAHGTRKIDAFLRTQRVFLNDPQFSDPYFWAPFTASGDNGALALTAR